MSAAPTFTAQRRDVSPRLPLALPRARRRTARERDAAARPGGDCAREPLGISDDGSPDIRLHGNMRRFLFAFVIRLVVGVCAGAVSASLDGSRALASGRCGIHPWCDTSLSSDERAGLLLEALTPDERVSLLGGVRLVVAAGRSDTHPGARKRAPGG